MPLDIAPAAIALSRSRGAAALVRDVFGRVPGEGRWASVLLMDGNVGIGGDVDRLLRRVRELLGPGGRAIVETHGDAGCEQFLDVRFRLDGHVGGPLFPWAVVGADVLAERAGQAGLAEVGRWTTRHRTFVELRTH